MSGEQLVPVRGVDLCVETFGERTDPAVLLIGGMSASMDFWDDAFCAQLAAGRRYVIRYDHRDTGRSTTYPPGRPGYTGADLRADAVALLDALDIDQAHLVGISMGGAIAQEIAVDDPGRVSSLTLMSTTTGLDSLAGELPPVGAELSDFFESAAARSVDWSDRAAVAEMLVEDQRAFMRGDVDEERLRTVVERVVERSRDLAAMENHGLLEPGPAPEGTLADITAPTLVIHGSADPMFAPAHGEALARAISGAELLLLDEVGHEAPPPHTWRVVIPELLRHTER